MTPTIVMTADEIKEELRQLAALDESIADAIREVNRELMRIAGQTSDLEERTALVTRALRTLKRSLS